MNLKYFIGIKTLEELKKQYRELAIKNHPDKGGNAEIMKVINAEYDEAFSNVKNTHKNSNGEIYTKESAETPEEFRGIMDRLMKMCGIEIEIIGCFVWLSGNTREHKDSIKAMGFRWHGKKKMWYKSPEGYRRRNKKQYSMDEIRDMYGTSGTIHGQGSKMLQAGA